MLKLAIVDDDEKYREEIISLLEQYEREYGEVFIVSQYTDGDELTENYKSDMDIILLDIEMEFMDGMTAAEYIRKLDQDVIIVFITNMPQYAIKGYQVGALDYILKPLNYYAFSQTIKRAIGRRKNSDKKYLYAVSREFKRKVDVSDILYIEVINHDLYIHTKEETIESKGTIRDLEQQLKDMDFFLCNKGYLVNLAYVDAVAGSDIVIGEDRLQVSRAKKKPLIEALNRYMAKLGH
ncbi:MAG: response regulator transcription factor [Butyrivibrio sp.]|nr:response regulator transcription factor [Butyrivibrio sp.]